MTCEVAVLNKYAVVIAADSAVTTTNGQGEPRYSKGGNKIFQLSHTEPVGVMIFGTASVCGMPWEVVIKAYRADHLQTNKFDSVQEYAENFFSFLQSAASPISTTVRDDSFVDGLQTAAGQLLSLMQSHDPTISDAALPSADRAPQASAALLAIEAELDGRPYKTDALGQAAARTLAAPPQRFRDIVFGGLEQGGLSDVIDLDRFVAVACKYYFRNYESLLPTTGVVFAGYGKLEYFPCLIEYSVAGFMGDHLAYDVKQQSAISNEVPSNIIPFAMTSAVEAFMRGVGFDVFASVDTLYRKYTLDFARSVLGRLGVAEPPTLEADAEQSREAFTDDWYGKVLREHYHPLRSVISALPLEEMAHLAETLVTLESLKERVTTPKQSVGGPIDVAVITKSEGLVWIKRKHFFDSDKNLRFILRQRAIHQ
ncbi:hypothetical protein [Burkholderia sp. BCC0398]|uniref:hypothetical protein n=1 Tax=Burkholderia sp. BCC0398 TaxID=2676297 RepID=UPI00158A7A3A|nr:hypothetical protein [Burkholderia sp. BCC0398]